MFLSPVIGIILSPSSDLPVNMLGLLEIKQLINSESMHGLLRSAHGFCADVLLVIGSLHILAAIYHQFWLKDHMIDPMIKS